MNSNRKWLWRSLTCMLIVWSAVGMFWMFTEPIPEETVETTNPYAVLDTVMFKDYNNNIIRIGVIREIKGDVCFVDAGWGDRWVAHQAIMPYTERWNQLGPNDHEFYLRPKTPEVKPNERAIMRI